MFDNVGEKIKNISKQIFMYELAVFVLLGIIQLGKTNDLEGIELFLNIIWSVLIVVIGFAVSYLSVILAYGFGELIENSKIIADALKDNDNKNNTYCTNNNNKPNGVKSVLEEVYRTGDAEPSGEKLKCKACNLSIKHLPCPYCGYDE